MTAVEITTKLLWSRLLLFSLLPLSFVNREINELTGIVVDKCMKIHKKIGPGCFEKVDEEILYYELTKIGLDVRRQILLPISNKN